MLKYFHTCLIFESNTAVYSIGRALGATTFSIMTFSIRIKRRCGEFHYAKCRIFYCYAECHYAECHFAECQYAVCHYDEFRGEEPPPITLTHKY